LWLGFIATAALALVKRMLQEAAGIEALPQLMNLARNHEEPSVPKPLTLDPHFDMENNAITEISPACMNVDPHLARGMGFASYRKMTIPTKVSTR